MSFGYSIGDIVSLVQLAWKTVQNSRKACGEHDEFTREASSLHVVIQSLEKESSKPDSPINHPEDTYKEELWRIVGGCSKVLTGVNRGLEKYNTLSQKETSAKKLLQEVVFGNGEMPDMRHLREQMTYYNTCLSLFLNMISIGSIGRVDRQMKKAGGEIEEILIAVNGIRARARLSLISNRDSILTTYEDDDKAVWKEFRKELYQEGFSSAIIEKHKTLIKAYIRELADRGLLDDESSCGLEEPSEVAGTLTDNRSSKGCREEEPSSGAKSSSISTSQLSPRPESVDQYYFRSGTSKSSTNASPILIGDEYSHDLGETLEDTDVEGEGSSGAESSFSSTSQLSPRRESGNQYSFRSRKLKIPISGNPRLLETVESVIRRLIMPGLETLKQEQKVQQSRQEYDRGRSSDSPFDRRLERAISVETVMSDEEESFRRRSKEHHLKDGGESFTAWLLNNLRYNDSRSSTDREKRRRRRSKGSTRIVFRKPKSAFKFDEHRLLSLELASAPSELA